MRSITITFLLLSCSAAFSQTTEKNTLWMEYLEELSENEMEASQIETLYDELSFLSEHPLDLNTTTKQDLERIPFLSGIQIENLLYHIYKYGPLNTIYELKNIEGLDYQTIQKIIPFVTVEIKDKAEPFKFKNILTHSKNQMLIRMDNCLQKKAGYRNAGEEEKKKYPNRFYLGEPYYLSFRYGFQYEERIQFSLTGEKDQGEAFWNRHHKGFDFYSANFSLKNSGIMEGIHLGDYRASFGQGLVLNTDFAMGKTSDVNNIGKKNSGIKRHFSTNENNFFRGIALALKLEQTKLHLFASHRNLDARSDDSTIFSFKTDGYNRTYNDLEKHRQVKMNVAGANLQWENESFRIGTTITGYNFGGKKLDPELKPYNVYYLRGENNYNLGIDYSYHRKKLLFQGETAMGKNKAIATIHNLLLTPASFFSFSLSYRNYHPDYQSYFGNSLAESSTIQNESGLYFGAKYNLRKWQFAGYIDVFRFPWLKYGIDSPSSGKDLFLQFFYNPGSAWNMNLRYKFKEKEKNKTEKTVDVISYNSHKWKYQLDYKPNSGLALKTQFDYNIYLDEFGKTSGWAISQTIGYKNNHSKFHIDFSFAYFDAINWNNRIYSYEKNILYVFNTPSYYGEGIRYYTTFKWNICPVLNLYTKISTFHYFDKNAIGSGLEEINKKEKTEINFILKVIF